MKHPDFDRTKYIYLLIVQCEGGKVLMGENQDVLPVISPDIPERYWCDLCKRLLRNLEKGKK